MRDVATIFAGFGLAATTASGLCALRLGYGPAMPHNMTANVYIMGATLAGGALVAFAIAGLAWLVARLLAR